jgi:hypothetical protein
MTLALDVGEWSASRPGRFTPSKRAPGIHWAGGWVGPRAVLDTTVKRKIPSLRRESNRRTPIVQLIAAIKNNVSDYINLLLKISHIVCNHPLYCLNLYKLYVFITGYNLFLKLLQALH